MHAYTLTHAGEAKSKQNSVVLMYMIVVHCSAKIDVCIVTSRAVCLYSVNEHSQCGLCTLSRVYYIWRWGSMSAKVRPRKLVQSQIMVSVHRLVSLLAGFLFCCCSLKGEAAQCMPDWLNPCIARCNGTSFDLSKAFNFP